MPTPPRELTLDQLRTLGDTTNAVNIADEALAHAEPSPDQHVLALLEQMLRLFSPADSQHMLAHSLAELARQVVGLDLCVVMFVDSDKDEEDQDDTNERYKCLSIRASSPDVNAHILAEPPKEINAALWRKLLSPGKPGQIPMLNECEQDALNPLKNVAYKSRLIVPLVTGEQCVGVLYGYSSRVLDLEVQESVLFQTISSYAAMAIASRALLDLAHAGAPVNAVFDDLLADNLPGEDALRARIAPLGYDVTQPSSMLMLEICDAQDEVERKNLNAHLLGHVHTSVREQYPSSLISARSQCLCCIIPTGLDRDASCLDTWLTTLMQQIESDYSDYDVRLSAGIGTVCCHLGDYARGFVEAREALQIGKYLRNHAGSLRFDRLAPYRYLLPFAREQHLGDAYLSHIETLALYDREHKRGNLLRSMETFLALGGNIKDASELLNVHRNTLTQRLDRIQSLCGINLDAHHERFALQMAIMIYRLRP